MTSTSRQQVALTRRRRVGDVIATAFIDGIWFVGPMTARAAHDLSLDSSAPPVWLSELAALIAEEHPEAPENPKLLARRLAKLLPDIPAQDDLLLRWMNGIALPPGSDWARPNIFRFLTIEMGEPRWPVRTIHTVADLAQMLSLDVNELLWYADTKLLERSVESENLRHYTYRWLPKRRGGSRLLEIPKENLKTFQRQILRDILDHVPPHPTAHGFRQGRSIQSFVGPHCAQPVVIRLDIRDFFTSVSLNQIIAIFRSFGYANDVAVLLAGLTTNAAPAAILRAEGSTPADQLRGPHLPQGSPTSPALANLAVYQMDARLNGLATALDGTYTRYADDLAFSGPIEMLRAAERFVTLATSIIQGEGYRVNTLKTSIRQQSDRQVLTGLVVNSHPNIHRADYDRLRAILHDAKVNGIDTANRSNHPQFRSYLQGHIGFVQATNPRRAIKLWKVFDSIDWSP